ncbi:MAG: reverse transcriptase domain-containing protein [Chryseobacterium sp.]|uniref:reverse transcriptase domain-containing protein n=1 Tax=Chryseobacterium TaxID=59732 RepID=UPI0005513745|nr:reverse transcriptase domain-containing protein [Chryseobacterium jejuense]MBP2619109.1 RNA-directed DNA polymerase [Chryseobacterium jejuense]
MEYNIYKEKFTKKAIKEGLTETEVNECLIYAKPLIENGLPIIFNTSHFSKLVGVRKTYIKRAAIYSRSYYRSFTIAKRNGNPREISEPLPNLKLIQNYILSEILYNVKISAFAKAYKKKTTIIENTRYHVNQKKLVTLDIRNFFSSIKKEQVYIIFNKLGYSEIISDLFSKLCTLNDQLPQGAPTSPFLSNIFMSDFDMFVADYCTSKNIRYTRYADDISLSGDFDEKEIIELIIERLKEKGLELNNEKTKIMLRNQRQIVTGIVVNEKNQVPRKERLKLRQEVFHIRTKTLEVHKEIKNIKNRNYLYHLYGKISYVVFINPNDKEFIEYKEYIRTLFK